MTNKIRLDNDKEFALVGYGYSRDDIRKEIQFRFSSDDGIGDIQVVFKDTRAISKIHYLLIDGTIKETITDCAAYQSIMQDSEGKYIVTLSTDKVSVELKTTKLELEAAKEQIAIANAMINAFADTIVLISAPMR